MKIAFTSIYGIDPKIWSGTTYQMANGFVELGNEIIWTKDFVIPFKFFFRAKSFISYRIFNYFYFKEREPLIQKSYAKYFNKVFNNIDYDFLLSSQASELTFIESNKPMIFWVDATFFGLMESINSLSKISKRAVKLGYQIDEIALKKSNYAVYASDWAAETAIEFIDNLSISRLEKTQLKNKIRVAPFGANLKATHDEDEIKKIIESRSNDIVKLLFIGIDWKRKGGDIAVNVIDCLNSNGINAELNVVGCSPNIPLKNSKNIKLHGFIDKNSKIGLQKFFNLLSESHFFIMPSYHEPFGIVYCEANSFGLPCLACDVEGVSSLIKNGKNGYVYSKPVNANIIANDIISIYKNRQKYNELAFTSYIEYKTRLNWQVSCKKVIDLLS